MKSLLIIRHAKSSWDTATGKDFDRPLNDRGKRDAPEMARRLVERNITIDAFVSSTAKRAQKTAQLFALQFQKSREEIILLPELYEVTLEGLYKVAVGLPDKFESVAIFSHNPGVTEFVNTLTGTRIDDMPTCGIFAIKIHSETWADFKTVAKDYWFFQYPKLKS